MRSISRNTSWQIVTWSRNGRRLILTKIVLYLLKIYESVWKARLPNPRLLTSDKISRATLKQSYDREPRSCWPVRGQLASLLLSSRARCVLDWRHPIEDVFCIRGVNLSDDVNISNSGLNLFVQPNEGVHDPIGTKLWISLVEQSGHWDIKRSRANG